jgi:hypothetical protein
VNEPGERQLARPRDRAALFADSLRIFYRNLATFLPLSAAVVVPVSLIVSGFGLEQLTAGYDPTPAPSEYVIPGLVNVLVVTPLMSAMCIHVLRSMEAGGSRRAREALVEGFEAFTPIFFAVALAAVGIALGLVLFVAPGVYLFIRWYFIPQTVVIEGARGPAALTRSVAATRGYWWRTFGVWVLANVAALLPAIVLAAPFTSAAESSDRAVWSLVGMIVAEIVSAPFLALVSTLLYYDLRARGQARPG